ncbi:MAG: outer membrane protein transport protein [Anaeromyxobacter sp.]
MNKLSLSALALVLPALASASGYEVIAIHPRDLALTSSAVAAQDGAAAAFFNPAALSKVDGFSVSAGLSMLSITTDWDAPSGSDVTGSQTSEFEPVTPIALYLGWGTKVNGRGLGFGFGVGNPAGGNVFYDAQWEGRGRIIEVQRRIFGLYGSTGYELVPERLRVGGSVIYYKVFEYLKQGIQPYPEAHAELDTSGGGWAFGLSAEGKPFADLPITLAVDYKHSADIHATGDGNFNVPPALEGPSTMDQGVTHDFTFPNLLAAGVAWRVSQPVQLTLQYSYSNWSVYQDDTFEGDQGLSITVPRKYDDGHIIRGGVEWFASKAWTLRAGFMRDWSGLNTDAYSPTLPDSSIWAGAVGAGWNLSPNLQLNAAFFYGIRDQVKSTNWRSAENPEGTFPGVYNTDVWITSLGVTWNLPSGK